MRSNTQELHRLRTGVSHQSTKPLETSGPSKPSEPSGVSPDVLDEAFALVDESTWRCDSQHASEAEESLEQQLALLAEQSRKLTQLLGKLRSHSS